MERKHKRASVKRVKQ